MLQPFMCSQPNILFLLEQCEDLILYIWGGYQSMPLIYPSRENLMFPVRGEGKSKKDHVCDNLWLRPRNDMSLLLTFYCLESSDKAYPTMWERGKQCLCAKEEKKTLSSPFHTGKNNVHNGTELLKILGRFAEVRVQYTWNIGCRGK